MDYSKKYFKYKLKYLNLKNLYGGAKIDTTKHETKENLNTLFKSENKVDLEYNYDNILKTNINFTEDVFRDHIVRRHISKLKYNDDYYIIFDSYRNNNNNRYKIVKKINNNDQYKLLDPHDPNIQELINTVHKINYEIITINQELSLAKQNLEDNISKLLEKDENANKEKNEYTDDIARIEERLDKLYKEHYIEIDNNDG